MSFFNELKRRNVFRVAIAYVITAWLLLQVVDLVLENINAPDWIMQVFMLGLAIGFPLAVFFAWAFELTPDGVKRESQVDRSRSITPATARKLDRSIIIVLAVALAWFAWDKFQLEERNGETKPATIEQVQQPMAPVKDSPGTSPGDKSVAVLPFINLSDDKENEYFSDGISEELLNVLVKIEGLRVPSRTSSFTFKGSGKKVTEIGRELQVNHVLEGSVMRVGDRVRISAQLIDAETGHHEWAEQYDRPYDNLLDLLDEVAGDTLGALKLKFHQGDAGTRLIETGTDDPEAFNLVMLGAFTAGSQIKEDMEAALGYFNQAIALDPEYIWAYMMKAGFLSYVAQTGAGGDLETMRREARDTVAAARALRPEGEDLESFLQIYNTGPHLYLFLIGNEDITVQRDWAERFARKTLLNNLENKKRWFASDSQGHGHYGESLSRAGLFHTAQAYLEQDPKYMLYDYAIAMAYAATGDVQTALDVCDRVMAADPANWMLGELRVNLLFKAGRPDEAEVALNNWLEASGRDNGMFQYFGALARAVWTGAAWPGEWHDNPGVAPQTAYSVIATGRMEEGLDLLQEAIDDPRIQRLHLAWFASIFPYSFLPDPVREDLAAHPRYQAMLAEMGYTREWSMEHRRRAMSLAPITGIPVDPRDAHEH